MTPALSPDIIEYIKRKKFQDINSEAPSVDAVAPESSALDKVIKPIAPSPAELSPMLANTGPMPRTFEPPKVAPISPMPQPMIDQAPDIKTEAPLIPGPVQPLAARPRDLAERPVAPYEPTPATQLHEKFHDPSTVMMESDFEKPSKLRSFLGTLAGIGTGFVTRDIGAGMAMASRVKHPDYYRYLQERGLQHEDISKLDEIQAAREEARQAESLNQAKMAQEYGTADWRRAQAMNEYNPIEHPQTLGQVQSINQAKAAGTAAGTPGTQGDPYEITFTKEDGTTGKLYATKDSKSGKWSSNGVPLNPDVANNIKSVRRTGAVTEANTPFEVARAAFVARTGHEPQTKEEVQEVMQDALTPEQRESAKVDVQLKRARISKLLQDVNNDRQVDAASDELADLVHENPGFVESLSGKSLVSTVMAMRKKGYAVPGKLTAAAKSREEGVTTLRSQLNELEALVKKNRRRLGPIMGNVGKAERGIGWDSMTFDSDQEKKDSQTIRSLVDALVLTEAQVVGGGQRPAVKVIEMLQNLAGKTTDTATIMDGAFEAARKTASAREAGIEKERYGNQKNKKEEARTAQGGYTVGHVYGKPGNQMVYLGGDPNDLKNSWRPK